MEQTEVATDPDNREKNSRLVPIMLQRLRALKEETSGQPPQPGDAAPATASTVDQRGRYVGVKSSVITEHTAYSARGGTTKKLALYPIFLLMRTPSNMSECWHYI